MDRYQCFVRGGAVAALRGIAQTFLTCLLVLIALAGWNQPVFAAGSEVVNREDDIVLTVDSRWPGNAYGGYFPLRIKLSNMGPPRDLLLVYEGREKGSDSQIPEVRRSVRAEQQATISLTLSIPVVSKGTDGVLRVYDSTGSEFKGLTSRHSLPDYGGLQTRTTLLVISTNSLDDKVLQPFEDAAATEYSYLSGLATGGSAPPYYRTYPYSARFAERDHVVLSPSNNLPVNWVDYSGLDVVAVAWPDWSTKLNASEREAILKWSATGGVLILFGTGKPAAQHEELQRSLQLDRSAAVTWVDCLPDTYRSTNITTVESLRSSSYSGAMPSPSAITATAGSEQSNTDATDSAAEQVNHWKIGSETFSHRDWMLGKVYVFPDNPFPGTASDWVWWLASLPKDLSHWPKKQGMSSRTENNEFLNFLIPGVGTVPVFAFLTLITVFTIIIGPLNYYWLLKRRRLAAMVFTVPFIAAVTCLLLFGYSLVADGFSIRSRVNSFTWLDQDRKSAVSRSRLCLYAPFAPSAGLNFSPECAVFPIWQKSTGFESGVLDWSGNDQRLTAGWFRSQTWTQFQTVEHRDERGRLDFTPPADPNAETITVSNGLSWDLEYVAVKGTGPHWYAGENVPAGATAQLKRQQSGEIGKHFTEVFKQKPWDYPQGISDSSRSSSMTMSGFRGGRYGRFGYEQGLETDFSQALLRRNLPAESGMDQLPKLEIYDWRDARHVRHQEPHSAARKPHYWALCRQNPGIQTGVKSSVDQNSLHVLFGTF